MGWVDGYDTCGHPGCDKVIESGLRYRCGILGTLGATGGGLYLCPDHINAYFARDEGGKHFGRRPRPDTRHC